ncbi:maleylpyruvate isomerase N-terminal domain-containing protein [Brevibacterium spongiae]|uniref:Maleylpyruvate isomerase N-terminal domain-containing protein n=1 Tax=Brevibacterium spongiae TaxID=2909672 RepID=A0ABY5STD9_9MICO|nr:maleylpyruvate isomerase N-terminal domain-containing protein [Brevibacterium spongiae]UVI37823.1 maleylpyruvate isomerase N-terminal domain-containing protein [Brevibacterium spongiae]
MDSIMACGLDRAEACWVTALERVAEADLTRRSGAEGWTNAELINHLIGGGVRYTLLLRQADTAEVEATRSRNHLGDDLLKAFWAPELTFRDAAGESDLDRPVAHRIGEIPGTQLVQMRILELALHAADLARGTGHDWPIDDTLAEFISTELGELIIALGSEGGYKAPRLSGKSTSHAQRVLLLSGR